MDDETFCRLLVLIGGKRCNKNGNIVDATDEPNSLPLTVQLRDLAQHLPGGNGPFERTMRWFFADRATRNVSPMSDVRIPHYWETLFKMGAIDECDLLACGDLAKLQRLDARLRELHHETPQTHP